MSRRNLAVLLASFFLLIATLSAQTVTGSITGVVEDPHGSVIPSVDVKLISQTTAAVRSETTDQRGEFTFNAVEPDTYTLVVEHSGFKKYDKKDIVLNPSDHLSAGQIKLQIGAATESVDVIAEGAAVQTASSERSGVITSEQVQDLTVINRDFTVLASLQPGVVYNPGAEAQSFSGGSTFNVNGSRVGQNNITIDGVPTENTNGTSPNTFISMDAVSQVKVQTSNYQAEFGRNAGAAIQAVSKAGGLQYHGALYWYQRNNIFDALQSFSKTNAHQAHVLNPTQPFIIPDARYRFITTGVNFGGPVYIPKLIPRDQKKLFFFVSEEQQREDRPQDVRQVTVPTLLERQGNFSLSNFNKATNTYGPLVLADPTLVAAGKTCKKVGDPGCFPNGIIPANRINALTQSYLNLFPIPNSNLVQNGSSLINAGGTNFNYQVQESLHIPKHTETLRVDYDPTPSNLFYVSLNRWWDDEKGFAVPAGNSNWGWLPSEYNPIARFITIDGQHIFSPTLVFEGRFVYTRWTEGNHPSAAIVATRSIPGTGINLPQLDPQINPLQILPNATFGGISNSANPSVASRYPIFGTEGTFTYDPVFTKVLGPHTFKTGMFIEDWQVSKATEGNFNGSYDFSANSTTNFPTALGNTTNAYANALIGDFQSYTQSTTRPPLIEHYRGLEWFAQDNWKVFRNLTLDLGVRLGWSRPFHNAPGDEAAFVPTLYDRTQMVQLVNQPSSIKNGSIVNGSGNPVNGSVTTGLVPGYPQAFIPNYPLGFRSSGGVKAEPRFGFSYDPFGDGKTAIRGGFGMFYQVREQDNFFSHINTDIPVQFNPTVELSNLTALANGINTGTLASVISPSTTHAFQRNRQIPYIMAYNFGIQHEIGFKTVIDIAYVASLGHHLLWETNLNAIPAGTTTAAGFPSGTSNNLLRPYIGYGDIIDTEYKGSSKYNSLQAAVNRRFTKSVDFTVAYTWSRAFDYTDNDNVQVLNTPFAFRNINFKQWQYGMAGYDHTHIFRSSFTWNLPKASRLWDNGFMRGLLDNWAVSGITTFQSGAPSAISLDNVCQLPTSAGPLTPAMATSSCSNLGGKSFSGTAWSGSPTEAARVLVLGTGNVINATTPFAHTNNLNGLIFAPPMGGTLEGTPQGTNGFAPSRYFRGPGIDNWDMSLFKNFQLSERFKLQFRAEAYDLFNHTNFTSVDTKAQFQVDSFGSPPQQVNQSFGQYTGALLKRRMQLALRLQF